MSEAIVKAAHIRTAKYPTAFEQYCDVLRKAAALGSCELLGVNVLHFNEEYLCALLFAGDEHAVLATIGAFHKYLTETADEPSEVIILDSSELVSKGQFDCCVMHSWQAHSLAQEKLNEYL